MMNVIGHAKESQRTFRIYGCGKGG